MQKRLAGGERRQFHRILYQAAARLSDNERSWPVQLIDLSLHGCLLRAIPDWVGAPGASYRLSIQLCGPVEIEMNLVPVRSTAEHTGFQCTHMDLESICRLRRLVELNLGDASLLERDLQSLTAA